MDLLNEIHLSFKGRVSQFILMALAEGDYLKWYNDEISRYRNHEWQLASYSIAISTAVLLFVNRSDTADIVPRWIAAVVLVTFVLALLAAEMHTHRQLNKFRLKRSALLTNADHFNQKAQLFNGWRDCIYLFGFLMLPLAFGAGAFWVTLFPTSQ